MKLTILLLLVTLVSCGKENTSHGDSSSNPYSPNFPVLPINDEPINDFIIRSAHPFPERISIKINGRIFFNECRFRGDQENFRVRISRTSRRNQSIHGQFYFENDRNVSLEIKDCARDLVFYASRHVEGIDEDRSPEGQRRLIMHIFNYRP